MLLTRKPEWAPNRYGLVAGFIEFGEDFLSAGVREVREETGLSVRVQSILSVVSAGVPPGPQRTDQSGRLLVGKMNLLK